MSIILGALGGAGEQLANVGQAMFKDSLDADREKRTTALARETHAINSGVDLQRQQTLEAYKETLKNAPLDRLGQRAKALAGEEVSVESAPVAQLSGNIPLADGEMGPKGKGFTGAVADARRDVMALPDGPDKTAAMKQLDAQVASDQKAADSIIVGARRKRTGDEAVQAALDEARKNGDLPAVAAYERELGKPARDERRIDAASAEAERKALADANRLAVDLKRLDLQAGTLDAQNRRIDAWIENEAAKRENDGKRDNNSPERLYSVVNAMNTTIRDLNANKPGASKPENERAEWTRQYKTALRVRDRASALLDQNLSARGAPDASTPGPAAAGAPTPDKAQAALPMPKEKSALQAGKVYQTSRGPAKWNGTAFEAQ